MRLGIHAREQAANKGFPEEVILAIVANPTDIIPSVGKGGTYRCDRCGGEQVRLRGKIATDRPDPVTGETYYDLWVSYNLCCEKIVTAFYADRPTPIRDDQNIEHYWWKHPDFGFDMKVTARTWPELHAQLAAANEQYLTGKAPRKPVNNQVRHNPNPKHNKSYYKKKKKQQKKEQG